MKTNELLRARSSGNVRESSDSQSQAKRTSKDRPSVRELPRGESQGLRTRARTSRNLGCDEILCRDVSIWARECQQSPRVRNGSGAFFI